ncbi:MAG TPA: alpha/beta hydrolase [Leptospiraceae bacterium]|nr:alpha/beta hydrolase [Leptospiraceae bacterium]HMY65631.1 alpha/beta hydrolase [Leptospiraceae bacterium]HMZ59613.1 alpha/beta hydrolase [Leptospiraceae bacterium]HNF17189.1 alpha/beta hydrolase [Leptospiraceae bacterium]HNF24214.1 alpha/beta hydrolase [Leptospiraceae bacterium]
MKEIHLEGHTITYEEFGTGNEEFVFLHGWCSCRVIWDTVIDDFTVLGKCYTIDLPGHYPGIAPAGFRKFTFRDVVDLQAAAIRKMVKNEKVTLVGHSVGGLVAIALSVYHPDLVDRVVAICPALSGPVTGFFYFLKLAMDMHWGFLLEGAWKVFHLPETMAQFFSLGTYDHDRFMKLPETREFLNDYGENLAKLEPSVMASYLQMFDVTDFRPQLPNVNVPALIIATKHDKIVPEKYHHYAAAHIPGAELIQLNNSGHVPTIEERDLCIPGIIEWLKKTDSETKSEKEISNKKTVVRKKASAQHNR